MSNGDNSLQGNNAGVIWDPYQRATRLYPRSFDLGTITCKHTWAAYANVVMRGKIAASGSEDPGSWVLPTLLTPSCPESTIPDAAPAETFNSAYTARICAVKKRQS